MDIQLLTRFAPAAANFRQGLEMAIVDADLSTPLRLQMFLAQCAHESAGFVRLIENLNYSEDALQSKFGKYFSADQAADYARRPERIANRIYANRNGNGSEASGDGWKYRGRGLIQLTGRGNYAAYSHDIYGDDRAIANPESVAAPTFAARSAAWFWRHNNLNQFVDRDDFEALTRAINGGTNGLSDRISWLNRAKQIFSERP